MHSFTDRSHPVIDSDLGTAPDGHQAYEMHSCTAVLYERERERERKKSTCYGAFEDSR